MLPLVIPPGTVLRLTRDEQRAGVWPIWIRIDRLGLRDDRWQLLEGHQLADDGTPMGSVQVWAALDALRKGLA
ncbi:hypothetical protein [Catenuloplanes indicus]|uniref:Uncharacterized protein n=1 Tax=Catenuloplanes indicus TaxID=137267 RepID=A0AAE3VYE7_9ACTN|nr:hypothetical protein [Catenuloplanes indicus]MDQ0366523.1 hypothetical protein [Catenuloplanes indicus]